MFLVLLDEPVLFVYGSPEEAAAEIELPDAHRELRAAFDERGVPFKPDRKPVQTRFTVQISPYRWIAAGPPQPEELLALIESHGKTIEPPRARIQVEELASELRVR